MIIEKKSGMEFPQIVSLLFLLSVYALWFFSVATGADIFKGNINIFSYQFDKLTSFIMFLTLITVAIPPYALGILDEENIKKKDNNKLIKAGPIDRWMGMDKNKEFSKQEFAEASFKIAYIALYTILGANIVAAGILSFSAGSSDMLIQTFIAISIFGIFIFTSHKNNDALLLGFVGLLMFMDKISIFMMANRISGFGLVLSIILLAASIKAFNIYTDIKPKSDKVKIISRSLFLIIIVIMIFGIFYIE